MVYLAAMLFSAGPDVNDESFCRLVIPALGSRCILTTDGLQEDEHAEYGRQRVDVSSGARRADGRADEAVLAAGADDL
jgi:hypothetical protein